MDDFAHSTTAPVFDSAGIVRRNRRRRGVLALTASAAVVAAAMTLTMTMTSGSSPKPPVTAAAPSASDVDELPANVDVAQPIPEDTAADAVVVPDLIGMDRANAAVALRAVGLDISSCSTTTLVERPEIFPPKHADLIGPDNRLRAGIVATTVPEAGHRVAPGTVIIVCISHS